MGSKVGRRKRSVHIVILGRYTSLAENGISEEPFLIITFDNESTIPLLREKIWAGGDLVWLGFSIDVSAEKCGIFVVKRRFALGELQLLLKAQHPTPNHVQSVAGSLQ